MKTWKNTKLKYLHIELSNLCNAACPKCPRYLYHTEIVDPSLTLDQITLDKFQKYFPSDFLKDINRITFCGTHGDPMTAKDLIPILEYIFESNKKTELSFNTNAGMRDPKFWSTLGSLLKDKKHVVTFSIDGLEDTNHLYRRRVQWKKVMENAQAFIDAGGSADWDYLIFGHNEHQIETARQMSKEMGFKNFFSKRALGFATTTNGQYKPVAVYNKNGLFEYWLTPPSQKEYVNQGNELAEGTKVDQVVVEWYTKFREQLTLDDIDFKYKEHINKSINCKFLNRKENSELYVNANGIIIPCCFMGSVITGSYGEEQELQVRKIIDENKDHLDLNKHSFNDILESGILDELFVKKWSLEKFSQGKPVFCSLMCGENNSIDRIFIDKVKK